MHPATGRIVIPGKRESRGTHPPNALDPRLPARDEVCDAAARLVTSARVVAPLPGPRFLHQDEQSHSRPSLLIGGVRLGEDGRPDLHQPDDDMRNPDITGKAKEPGREGEK